MNLNVEKFAEKLADFCIKNRWLVLFVSLIVAGIFSSGAKNLKFSNDYRVYFSEQNPELTTFEEFQNTFSKSDNIIFVIKPKSGNIFSSEIAILMEELTKQAWQIPFTRRVDSLTNFQYSFANGDDLKVIDFMAGAKNFSEKDLEEKKQIAIKEPLLYKNLISKDVQTIGVNVTQQFPSGDDSGVPGSVEKARKIAENLRQKYPDIKIVLSGGSMMNNAFSEAGMYDAKTLTPMMYLVMIIIMAVVLRSISGVFSVLIVIILSSACAMGIAGYYGINLTPPSLIAPNVILTLAVADSLHVIMTMMENMRAGMDKKAAIRESIRVNFFAVFITSFTSAIGFLTLNTLDSPPFWHLGNITAIGVVFAWAFSMTMLPALLAILPIKYKKEAADDFVARNIKVYSAFIIKNYRRVLLIMMLVSVFFIAMIPKIELNDEWVEYFDHRIPFRGDAEFAMKELGGMYLLEYKVNANGIGNISEPEYLENLEKFTTWLRAQPEVMHVFSYSDIIKRLNKNMNGDDERFYTTPKSRELAAQYLLLYEMSLPYGLDLNDRIDLDKSSTRLTVTLGKSSTRQVKDLLAKIENWQRQNIPSYMNANATGPTVMFAHIAERNIDNMLQGNLTSIIPIILIIMLVTKSIKIGLLSVVPNLLPTLITFGIWALAFKQIGLAAATVSMIALGIVIDDTVHFLIKYFRAYKEKNLSNEQAVEYAFSTVGKAIVATTIILASGFLVLGTSSFQVNSQLGLFTATNILIALAMDFVLLPVMLLTFNKKIKWKLKKIKKGEKKI
jgi:predicted RND superfamily exporter protein